MKISEYFFAIPIYIKMQFYHITGIKVKFKTLFFTLHS